jgi:3-methyladenine DNA glycosylase AlkD
MKLEQIIRKLKQQADPKDAEGMARFGIHGKKILGGTSAPELSKMARQIKSGSTNSEQHALALKLWRTGIHEAKSLATLIDDPKLVTEPQMENWVKTFENWADCDAACCRLFDRTSYAHKKILQWTNSKKEYIRRAGFVLIAASAVHDKKAQDNQFIAFFPLIKKHSVDERNFVKKAVNWALRQIGKRNKNLNQKTIDLAEEIYKINSTSSHWIATDALKELKSKRFNK